MSKPKLVTDGKRYAVREGNWFTGYKFYDLNECFIDWHSPIYVNKYCWGTKEKALQTLDKIRNYKPSKSDKMDSNKIPKNWVVKE